MNNTVPAGAIARLIMMTGGVVGAAERSQTLLSYDYLQDEKNSDRWNLKWTNDEDANAWLHVHQDGEIVDIYTESPENMLNVNYILMRFGWADCELHATSEKIKQMMEGRLTSISLVNVTVGGEVQRGAAPITDDAGQAEHTPQAYAETHDFIDATPADVPGEGSEAAVQNLDSEFHTIQDLTIKLGEAEMKNAELEESNNKLARKLSQLERQVQDLQTVRVPQSTVGASTEIASPLIRVIEKHINSMIDFSSLAKTGILRDLSDVGFTYKVKLEPAE